MTRSRLCLLPLLAAALDLKRPGLEAVASAVSEDDWPRAERALQEAAGLFPARWLWFDGGPFGYSKLFLADPGNYTYERSKWRSYFIDSPSHNVVLVDGQPRDSYVCHRVMRFVCGADSLVCGRRPRRPGDSEHCARTAGPGGPARTGGSAPRRNATKRSEGWLTQGFSKVRPAPTGSPTPAEWKRTK